MTEQPLVRTEIKGSIAIVTLNRPEKRNALSQKLYYSLKDTFSELPDAVRAVVFTGEGKHFCAGLDLAEHRESEPFESSLFSRASHEIVKSIRYCGRPVISALQGAVIGGGFEMASATQIRVADTTTFFRLPEGRRGFFLGGGGTVHVSRLLGPDRMTELMLTGRKVDAEEGQRLGLSHYLVPEGESLAKALELAEQVSENAPIANYMIVNAISQISEMPSEAGLFTESIAQALSLTRADAKQGIDEFLINKRDARFGA
ncbi:crotonase/enoyl-CoA hydratase family protein [Streptomyces phaeolivaceus]|uniref:Crotonase/enoyl-CoA hydratase family protein n=1 Tax=Streptomyces phaeolivaceus TaxID=2653200 RepID=A0A5P8JYX8_9ACTN|nr:crotonase/enoyl-CoA hydratase family protein [Streptomyces phaeolivaceus]QFQ95629.1 crotonase/enoyl-CoA hydratase family protein [Streptomyces phaeolivaceus]